MAIIRARILLFFALVLTLLPGCTGGSKARPGVLRVQLSTEPVSLDPSLAEDGASIRILANTWRGLPELAPPPEVSEGGRKYVFTLKEGAKWSDGMPLKAEHFVLGLKRARNPKTGAKLATMLSPIREMTAEGDRRLTLKLERAAPFLLKALSLSIAMPLRQDILDANGGKWPADGPSTGPFFLSRYSRGQKITLTRTGGTSGPGEVREVELPIVSDESAAMSLFERGDLDILTRVPTLEMARLAKKGVVRTDPFLATYYLGFNVKKAPFTDRELRRHVGLAINKPEIATAVATGETPARSWIPAGLEGFLPWNESARFVNDVVPVKGVPVTASFDTSARNTLVMEKVQHDLRRIGIELSLQNLDWKSYIHSLQSGATPLFRFAWLAPFLDPVPHLQVFTTRNPNNYTGWSNAKYDRLVREVEGLAPGPERVMKILAAQKILLEEESVIIPLYHYVQNHAVSARVKEFKVTPFGAIPFDEIRLSE